MAAVVDEWDEVIGHYRRPLEAGWKPDELVDEKKPLCLIEILSKSYCSYPTIYPPT